MKLEKKICEICGREFAPKRASQKICDSEECRGKRRLEYVKNYNKGYYQTCPLPELPCEICGKPFQIRKTIQTCCSPKCEALYKRRFFLRRKELILNGQLEAIQQELKEISALYKAGEA